MDNKKQTRRDMLRKTAMFAVPTIVSFKLSETQVQASNCCPNHDYSWDHNNDWGNGPELPKPPKGNNGNHYGNDKPDQNPQDWKNKHDGFDNKPPKQKKPKKK